MSDKKITENEETATPTKQDLMFMLSEMISNIERLPQFAMISPITHYDFCALLILLKSLFEVENAST
jgi:hypothetical protein